MAETPADETVKILQNRINDLEVKIQGYEKQLTEKGQWRASDQHTSEQE